MKYKVGDKVRVRSWASLEAEFGLDEDGDIKTLFCFAKPMRVWCDQCVTIAFVHNNNSSYRIEEDGQLFVWGKDCFGPEEPPALAPLRRYVISYVKIETHPQSARFGAMVPKCRVIEAESGAHALGEFYKNEALGHDTEVAALSVLEMIGDAE